MKPNDQVDPTGNQTGHTHVDILKHISALAIGSLVLMVAVEERTEDEVSGLGSLLSAIIIALVGLVVPTIPKLETLEFELRRFMIWGSTLALAIALFRVVKYF
jgi:hypothetical protein